MPIFSEERKGKSAASLARSISHRGETTAIGGTLPADFGVVRLQRRGHGKGAFGEIELALPVLLSRQFEPQAHVAVLEQRRTGDITPRQFAFAGQIQNASGEPTRTPILRIHRSPFIGDGHEGIDPFVRHGALLLDQLLDALPRQPEEPSALAAKQIQVAPETCFLFSRF